MVIESKFICDLFGVRGIIIWPFIFVINNQNKILVNHEKIHMAQAKELFVIGFYFLYLKYYLQNLKKFKGNNSVKKYWSYKNIPFEKECFKNQSNLQYLKNRETNAWKKYI